LCLGDHNYRKILHDLYEGKVHGGEEGFILMEEEVCGSKYEEEVGCGVKLDQWSNTHLAVCWSETKEGKRVRFCSARCKDYILTIPPEALSHSFPFPLPSFFVVFFSFPLDPMMMPFLVAALPFPPFPVRSRRAVDKRSFNFGSFNL
jgi:hypothetical protein